MRGRSGIWSGLIGGVLGVLLVGNSVGFATHMPADKAVASGSKLAAIAPGQNVSLLTARLRSSKTTDLLLSVSLECSILTRLVTGPSGDGGTDTAEASGTVRVWIEIDGAVVPINSVSAPPQNAPSPGNDSDKVTFCNRTYSRTVTDAEDPLDGQDIEDDYIDTKAAHAFNWVRLNAGSGIHTIVVKADLSVATTGDATAQAIVGNRTLLIEPAKMANDATV